MSLFTLVSNSIKIDFDPLPAKNGNGRQPSCSIGTLFSVIEESSLENLLGESTQFNIQIFFCSEVLPSCDRCTIHEVLLVRPRIHWMLNLLYWKYFVQDFGPYVKFLGKLMERYE